MRDGWASSTFDFNLTAVAQVSQNRMPSGTAAESPLYTSVLASSPSSLSSITTSMIHPVFCYILQLIT
jgi:hypothetical protein